MTDPLMNLPCGAWPSSLNPQASSAGAVSLAFAAAARGTLYWIEGRPVEKGRSVLMALDPAGSTREVLAGTANVRSRVHEYGGMPWAAVGDSLVYAQFDDQRLRMASPGGEVTLLTPLGCRYADGCAAPDGRSLVCVREDHRGDGEPKNAVVALNLDAASGDEAGDLVYGDSDFVAWPRLSADGKRIALVAWNHPDMPWDSSRLLVADFAPGTAVEWHCVAGGPGESVLEPQWAADGSLYFLSDRSGWWNLYRWHEGVVQAQTTLEAEIGGPLWQLGMQSWSLIGDGRALVCVSQGCIDSLQLLDLQTLALTPLELPYVAFSCVGMLDAHTAYAIAVAVDDLPALITIDLPSGSATAVRRSGPLPLPSDAVSRPQAISFPTADAEGQTRQAHAWFYPPHLPGVQPMQGELPPLIVMLHGGPTSRVGAALKVATQFWTTRGYAVVDVNYGGSSGYGRAYRERLLGQWGVVDLQDAVAAVDHLVALGWVDGARVAIRGGSAGGFTVLSALAFTRRFAAGINYFGVADLVTLAADTHKFESRYLDGLVAPLPAGADIYRQRSPLHHMNQCRAALITFQGSDDQAVPPAQSRDIVAAARAAGCPVAYLEFEGEGHGFRRSENIVRALESELVFLGRVFGYTPTESLPALQIDNAEGLGGGQ